jgi:diguanylate cyclase (GGDEF)-like protein/PAS domain S-box-containing protein
MKLPEVPRNLLAKASPGFVLIFGFSAMLILMVFLTAVGIVHLEASERRLERITGNDLVKISLANRMYAAARERTVSLQQSMLLTDPFERDDQWVRYRTYAVEFAAAREALLAMDLTGEERDLLHRQGQLTGVADPFQDKVLKLIMAGKTVSAQQLLTQGAIPAQERVLEQLKIIYQLQERRADWAAAQATEQFKRARAWLIALGGVTFALGLVVVIMVVRYSRRSDRALLLEKERAQVTLHSLSEAVIRADANGVIEYLNPVAARLTGWSIEDARGIKLDQVFSMVREDVCESKVDIVSRIFSGTQHSASSVDFVNAAKGGTQYCIELTATPLLNDQRDLVGTVLVFRDVTEIRALARELTYQATHDPLTGLYNRREFERYLQGALADARVRSVEYSLCYLDLDMFKVVNDTCGHLAGDELLRQLGPLLKQAVRKEDVIARVGGDEFAILLRQCNLERAEGITEQIRRTMKDFRFVWEDKTVDVGVSIGVVRLAADSGDTKDVFSAADVACRVAKEEGRNRVHVFRPNDLTITRRQREIDWVQRIGRAISENQFLLYGQWIRPLASGRKRASHCEVLIHMLDESGQIAGPSAFLPAAERYHLMPIIDRWVVQATFEALRGLPEDAARRLGSFNINLSGQTLCDSELLAYVLKQFEKTGVSAERICFEITETAAVTNLSSALRLVTNLKEVGCRFALDDFGSGVSSFSYLKNIPVNYLKIDGTFVHNIPEDQTDLAMVSSINQVAHIMGIETIAEYVENDSIRAALETLGVDYGQGFALARPELLDNILQELRATGTRSIRHASLPA